MDQTDHRAQRALKSKSTQGLNIAGSGDRSSTAQDPRRTDEIDLLIGKRLRARRSLLGLTQEDLAKRIKLSPQQLQKYEIGENRISAARLFALSKILQVPITWFFAPAYQPSHR